MIRSLFLGIALLSGLHCNTPQAASQTSDDPATSTFQTSPAFKLLDSKYENVVSGYNGARSTEYYFTISVLTDANLRFDSAWIDGTRHAISLSNASGSVSSTPLAFNKGKNIILRVSDLNSGQNKQTVSAPVNHDGKALIRYQTNSTFQYFIIKEIKSQITPRRS